MYLAYFDEVKPDPGHQPYFWLSAILIPDHACLALEQQVSDLAARCFGSAELTAETEFHGSDIFHRKGNFKSWRDIGERLHVLEQLAIILDDFTPLRKVVIRIDPRRMIDQDPEQKAFVFLVEKINELMAETGELAMLIGDYDQDQVARSIKALSRYRRTGTPWRFGQDINGLIDTVHYARSHHSRLIQLADIYVYILNLCTMEANVDPDRQNEVRARFAGFIHSHTRLLEVDRLKRWPTAKSWYAPPLSQKKAG